MKLYNRKKPTAFQIRVWNELKKIPFGETRSYKDIAILIGRPNASRSVANACASNPFPIEVPCHRVIRSDGSLGGYSACGGIKMKKKLIDNERHK